MLSDAERKDGGANKKMILACAFESLLGAIFLTYGYEFCEKFLSKIILYTIIPVGFANYLPVKVISNFNPLITIAITLVTLFLITIAFLVFYKGLKRYSSSNLMIARI